MFRGRELAHPEFGHKILSRVMEATKDLAQEDFDPNLMRIEGRNMTMVLSPAK
jgi:translation initiation factor IF-3